MSRLIDLINAVDDAVRQLYFACTELDIKDEEEAFDRYESALAELIEYSKSIEKVEV